MRPSIGETLTQKTTENNNQLGRLLAWSQPVENAQFVSASRADQLNTLQIRRIGDLLFHAPHRYLDLTKTAKLGPVPPGDATVVGTVYEVKNRKVRRPGKKDLNITEVTLTDGTGTLIGAWFNQPWVKLSYRAGQILAFSGSIKMRQGIKQIIQPFVEIIKDVPKDSHSPEQLSSHGSNHDSPSDIDRDISQHLSHHSTQLGMVLPVHPTTEGLSVGWLRRVIAAAVDDYAAVGEYLPAGIIKRQQLPSYSWALRNLHFPASVEDAEIARRRLAYSELLDLQVLVALRRYTMRNDTAGHQHALYGSYHQALVRKLPFNLSAEQENAVSEILEDMSLPHPMQRLLLGDVGTGKTIVSAFALAIAADSLGQAAMMAPTEVLAQQYAQKLGPLFDNMGLPWALLTGSTSSVDRKRILNQLESGDIKVIFGTHALIEPDIAFNRLTLAIVDEQHRFGVDQRRRLHSKGESVDTLVMTATPIPRTLTLTAFGDLDASFLRSRPIEGAGVKTNQIKFRTIYKAYNAVHDAIAAGQQAYIVCALVDESSKIEAQSAVEMMQELAAGEFANHRVAVLTGKMRPAQKAEIMNRFRAGKIDILVSTTVIEVGVDVHNATTMLILDADRFGLAQLHQLRGRVGRGSLPGSVWLVSDSFSQAAKDRFAALLQTNDGFELSELDLKLRGAGELLGSRQSGLPQFRIADLSTDEDLVQAARDDALAIIEKDPQLQSSENALVKIRIDALEEKLKKHYLS